MESDPSKSTEANEALRQDDLLRAIATLEKLSDSPKLMVSLSRDEQERLLRAAGRVAHPGRAAKRRLVRAQRQLRQEAKQAKAAEDDALLQQTQIRSLAPESRRKITSAPPAPNLAPPEMPLALNDSHSDEFIGELKQPRNCYICKEDFTRLHRHYDSMCPNCAVFNWMKRIQLADLSGRYALLTGGRVKIGFEAAIKLLRCGAHVIVTTRFPNDAAQRFAACDEFEQWSDRLKIFGLDLRHTPSVEGLARELNDTLPQLDFIINNACQTIRRPSGYYKHLLDYERKPASDLPPASSGLLTDYHRLISGGKLNAPSDHATAGLQTAEQAIKADQTHALHGLVDAAELSQIALTKEDHELGEEVFPSGQYDIDAQQMDLRGKNSWRLKLAEVDTVEMLEVHLVNSVAPFLFNARLKPLMLRTQTRDKHIVNVSAMEGVFYRAFKRDTHPHTNMAKASLNMMTRTSAADYIQDGIHMNSVDTGWITDEDPLEITQRKQQERGFSTPLDTIDAAARICDPIVSGIASGQHVWGKFLKDYVVSNW